ncbi:hypothetical protein KV112_06070 [Mycolicibacter sp. MYC123]|uniref:Uncharacterized protein n=1 Tax=[Mycobacterium] zoologicum TaxID=2872311 RepID=A0ABU5YGY5_9MYCO|nr:hypothetical protein [Mycolicibacter sp. MYC123]MEB3049311.1 hypothetical protein [Mycolicibacter sp. MYC123]
MPPENLEPRVAALEEHIRKLRNRVRASEQDATAARVLAGGADRDVGEIGDEVRDFRRATIASFNALREDMVDIRQDVTNLRQETAGGFSEMRSKLDVAAAGQQRIAGLIQHVIDAQDGTDPA